MSRRWPPAPPRRGRFFSVPANPPPPIPIWIPPFTGPARRPLQPVVRRGRLAQFPLGSFGPHETLWRLGAPTSSWQFGVPVTT